MDVPIRRCGGVAFLFIEVFFSTLAWWMVDFAMALQTLASECDAFKMHLYRPYTGPLSVVCLLCVSVCRCIRKFSSQIGDGSCLWLRSSDFFFCCMITFRNGGSTQSTQMVSNVIPQYAHIHSHTVSLYVTHSWLDRGECPFLNSEENHVV